MITRDLAERLRAAGVGWEPAAGDRFMIPDRDLDDDVFYVSDMTIEVHDVLGQRIVKFNGTTEWALDSVALEDALWLPREDQLRELLRATFRSLTRLEDAYRVDAVIQGEPLSFEHPEPADAYALALLEFVRRSA